MRAMKTAAAQIIKLNYCLGLPKAQFGTIIFLNYWDLSEVISVKLELRAGLNHCVRRLLFSAKRASAQWLFAKSI